jgi:ABC-type Zn uptake system ZnuABC Zn-binding protein ZnuA
LFAPFHYAFVQRGLLEVALLSVGAGVLGTWVVTRGLAFYTHAVGTAAFPGLVLADGLGFSAALGGFAAALLFGLAVTWLARSPRTDYDTLTGLVLVGALAIGVVLASDIFQSGANVEALLFGSLLLIGTHELIAAAIGSALVLAVSYLFGRRWLALGFDAENARALGIRSGRADAVLLVLIALSIVLALAAIGALLVTALYVVPAATVRLFTFRRTIWQLGSIALAAIEGGAGLWISVETNTPPGAAIAIVAGAAFALAAAWRALAGRRPLALVAAAVSLLVLSGCGGTSSQSGSEGPTVVATTTQIGDWVRVVGGSDVSVHQILQPNTDPHEYEPRPQDVVTTADANVVFESGDRLDEWMGKIVDQAGGNPTVVVLGDHVPVKLPGEASGPEASRYDPHWWHDPHNAEAAVNQIAAALEQADPAHRADYERNATSYLERLRKLDHGIASCLGDIPLVERKLVTDHDAFGYFAARYGIDVVGAVIPSQTTQAQPSARSTVDLIALIRREHVKAVFPESSINPRLAETIAAETGASADYTLYGDTLGAAGSSGATYVAMEEANADAMARGFTGGAKGCAIPGLE